MKAGWASTKIGDIAELVTKGTTPTSVGFNFTEEGVTFVKVECIDSTGSFVSNKFAKIGLDCHNALLRSQLKEGDLLFSIAGALGRAALVTPEILPANTNQALAIIRPEKTAGVDRRFLLYALSPSLIADKIDQFRGGVAQQNLSLAQVRDLVIPLPPLDEQKRIVAVLDDAFEGLSRARANAEANLADARELLASVLDEKFGQENLSWHRKNIAEVCLIGDGNHSAKYPKKSEMVAEGVPFIRSSNIQNGKINPNEMLFISVEKHSEMKKGHLKTDDILFTNRGEIGKVAIVSPEFDGANLNSQIAWLRCTREIGYQYLYFFLQSRSLRKHYLDTKSGAALQQFTIRMLKDIQVSFPSREEQDALVQKVLDVYLATESLEAAYVRQTSELDTLRQSLLQKAFSGELT